MWNTVSFRMRQPVSNFSSAWIDAPLRSSRLTFERCATTTKSAVCSGTTLSVLSRKRLHRAIVAHLSETVACVLRTPLQGTANGEGHAAQQHERSSPSAAPSHHPGIPAQKINKILRCKLAYTTQLCSNYDHAASSLRNSNPSAVPPSNLGIPTEIFSKKTLIL